MYSVGGMVVGKLFFTHFLHYYFGNTSWCNSESVHTRRRVCHRQTTSAHRLDVYKRLEPIMSSMQNTLFSNETKMYPGSENRKRRRPSREPNLAPRVPDNLNLVHCEEQNKPGRCDAGGGQQRHVRDYNDDDDDAGDMVEGHNVQINDDDQDDNYIDEVY